VSKAITLIIISFLAALAWSADTQQTIDDLSSRDWQVRREAAEALGETRDPDKQVVASLIAALKDTDSRVRRAAADALGDIGAKAYKSIPALVEMYDDIDPSVVAAAARATGIMGKKASRVIDDLTALLDHKDARVREAASVALGDVGRRASKSAFDLNTKLSDPEPAVRAAAAASLGQIAPKSNNSITDLVRVLDDEDESVRNAASGALQSIGKPAVPALVRALSNGDPIFLQTVVDTLGRIGPVAVPTLGETLHDESAAVIARGYAAMALAQIVDREEDVVPTLVKALDDENSSVRRSTAEALGHAGSTAQSAVAKLGEIATNSREEVLVREFAISALAKIAPGDPEVEATLVYVVGDGDARIYLAAVKALLKIRAWRDGISNVDAQVARLIEELESGGVAAAESLGLIGDDAEAAVPSLIRALESDDPRMRDTAIVALERIGPQMQTIPALVQAMRSGDLASRAAAAARLEAFARDRIDVWKPLLLQSNAPVLRSWLARHETLYGFKPDDSLQEARGEELPRASYFDVMGGRAAIRESIQIDLITSPITGSAPEAITPVESLGKVHVRSHPFDKMLKESEAPTVRVELADYVPQDRFFAWFRDIDALGSIFDAGAEQFLRFESSLAVKSVEYELEARYKQRLGISEQMLDQIQALNVIRDFAIVTSDLFFIDGSDVTIVANLTSPAITKTVLDLLGLKAPVDGTTMTQKTENGDEVFWTIRGKVLMLGTSSDEIDRMLTLKPKRDKGRLGNSSEFLYMQQQLTIGNNTEAYFYFSDAFIRHLVSPEVKIAQLRRMQARAEMEILVAGAMLYLLDGHRNVPSKQQLVNRGYVPTYMEDRDYTLSEDLIATSSTHGQIARLEPIDDLAVTHVTSREESAYKDFVNNYSRYWRQFFDPIAIRFDKVDEKTHEIQSFILPLLDSRVYNEVQDALVTKKTGQDLVIPSVTPAPSMLFSINVNDNLRVGLSQMLADMLVEYTSVDPEIFDSIGSGIHLAVQDSTPIIALGGGDIWGAVSQEMLNLEGFGSFVPFMASLVTQPATIMIELAEPAKVQEFLSEAVVKRAEVGGDGELHKLQGREAWIYTLNFEDIVQIHLRLEIQNNYLLISNLPWTTAVTIGPGTTQALNGAQLTLDLTKIEKQLPALHTKVFTDYRKAAVDGMGYLYPMLEAGVADSVNQANERHLKIFGFRPLHPSQGEWLWRDSYLESSEFGTAMRPVQPEFEEGGRNFGLFPEVESIGVNMQLEDTGLRATIRWTTAP
jgi:HEAT repeat protein